MALLLLSQEGKKEQQEQQQRGQEQQQEEEKEEAASHRPPPLPLPRSSAPQRPTLGSELGYTHAQWMASRSSARPLRVTTFEFTAVRFRREDETFGYVGYGSMLGCKMLYSCSLSLLSSTC